MSTGPSRNRKPRSEAIGSLSISLPKERTSPPAPETEAARPEPAAPAASSVDYPRLRTLLRDAGVEFKPIFSQRDVVEIIPKSDKTVRAWTKMGKIPSCHWPSGDPYYTPQNLEDFLLQCERGRREAD